MLVSVASHLTSILLSMSFVNALNEAGRDADVIRMFGEGQRYLATHKCNSAFTTGIFSLAVGILDMILGDRSESTTLRWGWLFLFS
ncbi:hypothetical protein TrRE_jg222 [Triparma retinervis]|uniref:Uncharacterized protein n=1 Tax=Triparma retinervis TaxID=2557542 RepID=A0A9W6ZF26_9STRA|nr:hypothetical protein TrRE_jg222 [Triparma retinervis]